ncbi:MAG: hypothetical protein ACKO5F_06120 [Synechococcus sp.]
MSNTTSASPPPPSEEPRRRSGRYRLQGGRSLDPSDGVHPEMLEEGTVLPVGGATPASPRELMDLQENRPTCPAKPERTLSANVKAALNLIDSRSNTPQEDLQIVLTLVRRLEAFHMEVTEELKSDEAAAHGQIALWAVDADRMMQARLLLELVELED